MLARWLSVWLSVWRATAITYRQALPLQPGSVTSLPPAAAVTSAGSRILHTSSFETSRAGCSGSLARAANASALPVARPRTAATRTTAPTGPVGLLHDSPGGASPANTRHADPARLRGSPTSRRPPRQTRRGGAQEGAIAAGRRPAARSLDQSAGAPHDRSLAWRSRPPANRMPPRGSMRARSAASVGRCSRPTPVPCAAGSACDRALPSKVWRRRWSCVKAVASGVSIRCSARRRSASSTPTSTTGSPARSSRLRSSAWCVSSVRVTSASSRGGSRRARACSTSDAGAASCSVRSPSAASRSTASS